MKKNKINGAVSIIVILIIAGGATWYLYNFLPSMNYVYSIHSSEENQIAEYNKVHRIYAPLFWFIDSDPELERDLHLSLSGIRELSYTGLTIYQFLDRCLYTIWGIATLLVAIVVYLWRGSFFGRKRGLS